ncbi:tetratricopeptide repeat protein [Bradyrhizobium sp. OAE829]|uniref:tetratricopeptide repeat protein n=1 Tax=Bradyrhizobium sp. OAE829 TaxID=2663807 RepID=UPI00178A9E11
MGQATTQPRLSLETLLAFGFGVVFCGILAYAGLRIEPITDPGQFFFLRVLAAISAAGVAAVIPGMLNIEIGQGKLFALRGAGALGVFAVVFLVNPPELLRKADESKRAIMSGNYSQGLYEDADRAADEILKNEPEDGQALNIKGGIAFYRGQFPSAVQYFRRARTASPKNATFASNYANALIETKAYNAALDVFKSIDDSRSDRTYGIGRAYFYAGNYSDAEKSLAQISSDYWHGSARIIEAAAIIALANEEKAPEAKSKLVTLAKTKFNEGYSVDRQYWDGIFSGNSKDKHQGYSLVLELLAPLRQEIASK